MAREAYFQNLHEKASETLIGGNAGKRYDCSRDLSSLFFDFEEALTSSNFDWILKFIFYLWRFF